MNDNQVVCVACGAVNRVPETKDASAGKCGSCGAPLFSGRPADVSGDMLQRQVQKGTVPVVVDVWAPWCGPCQFMGPEYEKVAQALEPRARFLKLNSDNEQQLAGALNIRGIPTMILFKDGKEADRVSGAMPESQINSWRSQRIG
ncbi:MAG: thioredoxin [Acetobacteraceae bacterium SCN 69-10]|nr:MAG: thioredoxin [Acetobacteraceae bacterium SCN 69-10]